MTYKFETKGLKIPRDLDGRRKLTEEQERVILALYHDSKLKISEIARIYKGRCSRRLIEFVIHPERRQKNTKPGKWKDYYNPNTHAAYMRKYRLKKRQLYLDKKLEG